MPSWDEAEALASLRTALADNANTKFIFKYRPAPPADGLTTRFFAGQTRIVPDTLSVYLNGALLSPTGTPAVSAISYETGEFEITPAPAPSGILQASYYYQWFSDGELRYALGVGSNTLGFSLTDEGMAIGLRPSVLAHAACELFTAKAAQHAMTTNLGAAGFQSERGSISPNWRALADAACRRAQELKDAYANNTVGLSIPTIKFVSYRLPDYVPRT